VEAFGRPPPSAGIYGHKPTLDIVSVTGHAPGGVHAPAGFSTLLAVAGPMARDAADLEAGLRVLGGLEPPDSKAFQWALTKPRHRALRDFRVGFILEDPAVPVSGETKSVLEAAVRACERVGATITHGWPRTFRLEELFDTYLFLLGAFVFSVTPPEQRDRARSQLNTRPEHFTRGALSSFADWQHENIQRLAYRAMWERFFESIDVFLLPTTFTAAFRHDQTHPDQRMIRCQKAAPSASGISSATSHPRR